MRALPFQRLCLLFVTLLAIPSSAGAESSSRLREARAAFQSQELIPARPGGYIINAGERPRIIWRDVDAVRELGCTEPLRIRWFDADLNEETTPTRSGRWCAWIEGTAPNGTPLRRSLTFFCRPYGFLIYAPRELQALCPSDGMVTSTLWNEHQQEIADATRGMLVRAWNGTEEGAALLAGLLEAKELGHPASTTESIAARHEDYQLALKLKVLGRDPQGRGVPRPRSRVPAARTLRPARPEEAGMRRGARQRLADLCREWAAASGEPFVTLIARRGQVVLHEAFGVDRNGQPVGLDYRCDVASITKTVSALLFLRFLDAGLVGLDDPLGTVLPDFPTTGPHAVTFRHCFNQVSGISGHGTWGGVRHPHLENILLNGVDVLSPGKEYVYSGLNLDLVGKALEMVSGKSARRLLSEELFQPLGLGDIPMGDLGAGMRLTALELAVIGQLMANEGSYGELELFSSQTFARMLPEDLNFRYPGIREEYGLALGWKPEFREGVPPGSPRPEDMILSPKTIGHGSITQCILRVDPERELVIVQVRREGGRDFGAWARKFFQAIVEETITPPGGEERVTKIP